MSVVDDFRIKYIKKQDLDHLIASLEKYYDVAVDLEGNEFVKIELDWDYKNKKVHLSMKQFLERALWQFDNTVPTKCEDSPYPHTPSKYGAKAQFSKYDASELVEKKEQMHIQKVTGNFLWYVRAVNGRMLTPLSAIAA